MLKTLTNEMYQDLYEQAVIDPMVLDKENCTINSYLKSNLRVNNRFGIKPRIFSANYMNVYDHNRCRRIKSYGGNFNISFSFPYTDVDKLVHDMFETEIDNDFCLFICNPKLYKYKYPNTVSIANVSKKGIKLDRILLNKIQNVNREYNDAVGEPLFFIPYSKKYLSDLEDYYSFGY